MTYSVLPRSSSTGRYSWRALPVPGPLGAGENGFPLSREGLAELITAVHEKGADFRFRARGFSMYPTIHDGDLVTVSPVRNVPPIPGCIAAFLHPTNGALVIHRLRCLQGGRFLGAGDNTEEPDGWIPAADILGVITTVERKGQRRVIAGSRSDPVRSSLSSLWGIHGIPRLNALRRGILSRARSSGVRRLAAPGIGALVRSRAWPIAAFTITRNEGSDRAMKDEQLGIELRFLGWHPVRMEFSSYGDDSATGRWWFTGAGIHPDFHGLGLEQEVFRYAMAVLSGEGVRSVWAEIPDLPGLAEFCRSVGFCEEPGLPHPMPPPPSHTGERKILKFEIGSTA